MSFARVRALVVVGVLALAAVVFVIVALVKDDQNGPLTGGCPAGAPKADLQLPNDPGEVTIKVYNGSGNDGTADSVSTEFKNRLFKVQPPAKNKTKFTGVAEIKYGPDGVGKAQLLRAYFLNRAKMEYSAKQKGDLINIVIGTKFQQLATTTEVNQSLVEVGEPTLPPGACPKPIDKKKTADS